jgi:hypothetical protein
VIEGLVTKAEEIDETLQDRERVFGAKLVDAQVEEDHQKCSSDGEECADSSFSVTLEDKKHAELNAPVAQQDNTEMSRLKMITGDLADIWLHEGNRALKYVGETKVGQKAKEILDNTIDYQEKYRLVKETSTLVIEKVQ